MPDAKSPRVNVKIDQITIRPGQTLTVMVAGRDSVMTHVEIRSVGLPVGNVGRVEIFCDEPALSIFRSFSSWRPMDEAVRERFGLGKLMPPRPASKGGEDGTA